MQTKFWLLIIVAAFIMSCKKTTFLDARPSQSIVVPASLQDLQAILDNDQVMNGGGNFGLVPAFGETGADDYYISGDYYNAVLSPLYQKCYTWQKQLYAGEKILDWDFPYRCIFYSNEVLDRLTFLNPSPAEQQAWDNEKGSALFYRAHMFYQLAQVFAPPYDSAAANTALGIPLRLQADINEKLNRASLQQTYDQVLEDLATAIPLLPVTPLYKTRPSKPAAYALMARANLAMQRYTTAGLYADSCLQLYNRLMNYNLADSTALCSFPRFNDEVLFNCVMQSVDVEPVLPTLGLVDSTLYKSYDNNDLRRTLFYKDLGGLTFLGTYDGNLYLFAGLATDEVYLIRSECRARGGNAAGAIADLNALLQMRWRTGTYKPVIATTPGDALRIVLTERRKELVMRGLRWTDLRRLNKDPQFAVTLQRSVNGQSYSLPPGDPRYTYPVPDDVIGFNPAIQQNPR